MLFLFVYISAKPSSPSVAIGILNCPLEGSLNWINMTTVTLLCKHSFVPTALLKIALDKSSFRGILVEFYGFDVNTHFVFIILLNSCKEY